MIKENIGYIGNRMARAFHVTTESYHTALKSTPALGASQTFVVNGKQVTACVVRKDAIRRQFDSGFNVVCYYGEPSDWISQPTEEQS